MRKSNIEAEFYRDFEDGELMEFELRSDNGEMEAVNVTLAYISRPEAPRFFKSEGKHRRFSFSAVSPEEKLQIIVTEHKPKKDAQSNISAPDKQKKRIKQDEELRGHGARRFLSVPDKHKKRRTRKHIVKPDAVEKDVGKNSKSTKKEAINGTVPKRRRNAVIPEQSKHYKAYLRSRYLR